MNLDSLALRALVTEAAPLLEGGLLQKISQLTEHDFLLSLRRPGVTRKLLVRLQPDDARVGVVEGEMPPGREPSGFTMLLRKHLDGKPLRALTQPGLERAVRLEFEGWTLVAEIPGRVNNLFLLNAEGRVAGLLRGDREGERRLRPGAPYQPPARPEKPDALDVDPMRLALLLAPAVGGPAGRALSDAVFGLPPHQAKGLCREAGLDPEAPLTEEGLATLGAAWDPWLQRLLSGPYTPVLLPGGKVSPWSLGDPREKAYPSMAEAVEAGATPPGIEEARGELLRTLAKARKKADTLLRRRLEDRERARAADAKRLQGELLLAHQARVPAGADRVTLPDWEGGQVDIALEPRSTAVENAQRLFKEYRRLQRAQTALEGPIEAVRRELDFLDELILAVETSHAAQDLEEIRQLWREERKSQGAGPRRRMQAPSSGPRRYRHEGFQILVGRNPRQNEKVTLKVASRDDLWFHARQVPGAHVVIRTAGRVPGESTIHAAAVLAARFSTSAKSSAVDVDWTEVQRVRKPTGGAPGYVTYKGERTLTVDPSAEVAGLESEGKA